MSRPSIGFMNLTHIGLKQYCTHSERKEMNGCDYLSFDICIRAGDKKTWKRFKALFDVKSFASIILTQKQVGELGLMPQKDEEICLKSDKRYLLGKMIPLDVILKPQAPITTAIELFQSDKEEEKKKVQRSCATLQIISNEDAEKIGYEPEKDKILLGGHFIKSIGGDIEKEGPKCYKLVFYTEPSKEFPKWDLKL